MTGEILRIEHLQKSFRSYWTFKPIPAVKSVSLSVNRGDSFGFLGHNGAGKTTTIRCVLGLIHKSKGNIYLNNKSLNSCDQREKIGYLPEHPYFYDHLTVEETLDFMCSLYGIESSEKKERIDEILSLVRIEHRRNDPVRALSKGLQQKLGFGQAILNRPDLLLLDEPFSGLDPVGRMEIRNLIMDLNQRGTTIFLSSHVLPDVEDICNRVSIMVSGELKAEFSLDELSKQSSKNFRLKLETEKNPNNTTEEFLSQLSESADSTDCKSLPNCNLHTFGFNSYNVAQSALSTAIDKNLKIRSFEQLSADLEEVFMKIVDNNREQ